MKLHVIVFHPRIRVLSPKSVNFSSKKNEHPSLTFTLYRKRKTTHTILSELQTKFNLATTNTGHHLAKKNRTNRTMGTM